MSRVSQIRGQFGAAALCLVTGACTSSKAPPTLPAPPRPAPPTARTPTAPTAPAPGGGERSGATPGTEAAGTAPAAVPGAVDRTPTSSTGPAGGALTPGEQRRVLERELESSLGEFDAMLLREQEEIDAERAAAAADGRDSGSGSGPGGAGAAAAGETPDSASPASEGGAVSAEARDTGGDVDGRPPTGSTGVDPGDESSAPADLRDGSGDDIVARQLREAAENEPDPELRDKLWDEYRKYRHGRSAKPAPAKTTEVE